MKISQKRVHARLVRFTLLVQNWQAKSQKLHAISAYFAKHLDQNQCPQVEEHRVTLDSSPKHLIALLVDWSLGLNLRRVKGFVTTVTEDIAIAPPASIGFKMRRLLNSGQSMKGRPSVSVAPPARPSLKLTVTSTYIHNPEFEEIPFPSRKLEILNLGVLSVLQT
jgi:hypothetical protein